MMEKVSADPIHSMSLNKGKIIKLSEVLTHIRKPKKVPQSNLFVHPSMAPEK